MAQEDIYIAVRSEALSKAGDARYVIKNRETGEVVDDAHGVGYKSPHAAHASFAHKQKWTARKSNNVSSNQQTNVARNAQSKKTINQRGLFD